MIFYMSDKVMQRKDCAFLRGSFSLGKAQAPLKGFVTFKEFSQSITKKMQAKEVRDLSGIA